MSAAELLEDRISFAEFLRHYEDQPYEFFDGHLQAMSNPDRSHSQIQRNLVGLLGRLLEEGPCEPLPGFGVHLNVQSKDILYVPDVIVVCDPTDNHRRYAEKPTVIFEIISESTRQKDEQEKFFAYQHFASLQEYVLVEQKRQAVSVARRSVDWKTDHIIGQGELVLDSIDMKIPLSALYEGVELSEPK